MIYANNQSSVTFPHGVADASTQTLTRKMFMQETDFTNSMAVQVLQWAYGQGKFSSTVGDHNGLSTATVKYGGQELIDLDAGDGDYGVGISYSAGVFAVKTGYGNKPLVMVSWYGAVMLCNWLTEMTDGSTANCVYSGIDTTWLADETVTDLTKTGYRLPTRIEYWYCARYRGNDSTNTVSGYTSPYFTQGDSASGATADYNNSTATAAVAVYGTSALADVKSKTANALGLYDMTGNVWKWLENYSGNGAYDVGSCWERAADQYLEIGVDASSNACNYPAWDVGFRMARTQ
ncbi:MAG: SUMF1/EgtB/PvdO family nonheme iron enzyme [Spirochaetes bacterium]|nr:SUMF1/EgtB/PvdO family nonheme iron enzyme [Spirochaetota bacterium]